MDVKVMMGMDCNSDSSENIIPSNLAAERDRRKKHTLSGPHSTLTLVCLSQAGSQGALNPLVESSEEQETDRVKSLPVGYSLTWNEKEKAPR